MSSNLQWILSAVQDFDISVSRAIELIECDRAGKFTDDMMPADARSRHIFALDDIPVVKYEELLAERDALAAKLAELEGQEPVAWMTANREMTSFVNFHDDDLPLFARPVHVEPVNARLLEAIKRLSFCAQTTGVTAGRDEELCAAIGEAEKAIAAAEPVNIDFGMRGENMFFQIGNQSFLLDYKPEEQGEFEFMKAMLLSAFSVFTHGVKTESQPVNVRLLDVSTGKLEHINAGLCPDSINGPDSRDPATDWADRIKARGQK